MKLSYKQDPLARIWHDSKPEMNQIRALLEWYILKTFQRYLTISNIFFQQMTEPFIAQTIFNADKSVDTFFMLGGLFTAFGILSQMQKTKRFNILYYYIHRIIR